MIFPENSLAIEECGCHYKSSCKKKKKEREKTKKKNAFCGEDNTNLPAK